MDMVLWICAGILTVVFLIFGGLKVTRSREQLVAMGLGWIEDFGPNQVRLIGAAEVVGATGVLLPALVGIAEFLVPLAAIGLALMMLGAIVVHIRRGERAMIGVNTVLIVLAAAVAWGRFGPYAFG